MKNVAIIFGGDSSEFIVSEKSAKVVYENLKNGKYTPFLVEIKKEGWYAIINNVKIPILKNNFSFIKDGNNIIFDAVFNVIHGTPGENGKIQGYFDLLGIPYNNSSLLASAITFDKWICNTLLKQLNIKSAPSILLQKGEKYHKNEIISSLGLPCFVKPNGAGSSFGVSKVNLENELDSAIQKAFEHDDMVVVETFIKGTEVTSGVISMNSELLALPITEIVPEGEFFDYAAKYEGKSQEITPARVSDEITLAVQNTSKKIYKLLNLKGMVRVDYSIQDNEPYLIEINTVPGLSNESIIPQQARKLGITLSQLFENSIDECLKIK